MHEYLEVGQIVNTNGLKGVLKINPFTDDIRRFDKLKTIFVQHKSELITLEIETVRYNKNLVFIKFKGIDTIEEAEKYKGDYIKVNRKDEEPLPENTYYIVDLLGLDVYTKSNEYLGKIDDIFPTGSNDIYVVKDKLGKQILLPAIKEVINKIDIDNKKIIVTLIDGLEGKNN